MSRTTCFALGFVVLLSSYGERAAAQTTTAPPSAATPPAPSLCPLPPTEAAPYSPDPLAPRGLLQQPSPSASCNREHFTPFMLGDFIGPVANLFSDVKVAEGESPRPTDRVFYRFNYYNNLDQADSRLPRNSFHNVDLYQNVFGVEKTFFDQVVSVELRVPFYTMDAEGKDFLGLDATGTPSIQHGNSFSETEFGNIATVVKVLLWEDRETGSLLSGGATLSFPTASSIRLNVGQSIMAYVQPYVGFIWQRDALFVQGFSSITLPVARPESIMLFNDLGVGYYIYRNNSGSALLRGIAPTLEVHVATPLRQADAAVVDFGVLDDVRLHDVVDFTAGATFEIGNTTTLGLGVAVPATGPKPFDFEVLAQLNYRF